jgi:ABC-2 type transport system permease protein
MARKEMLHILRDARSLAMALALPVFMILLFGYALTLDVDRIPAVVYDRDQTPESRELISKFEGSRYFSLRGRVTSYGAIEKRVDRGECMLGIVIPEDYSRDLVSGREAQVQLILDGSDSNTASIARGYVTVLTQTYNLERLSVMQNRSGAGHLSIPIDGRMRIWFNSEMKSKNYVVPGLIALVMMIIAALLTSLTIAREWEMGTMEQLLSTPVRPQEIVLGKMLAYFALGIADMIIAIVVGVTIFRVPMRGSYMFLVCTACVFLVGALCWGILLSAAARTQVLAYQLGMLSSFLPAFLLSGFVFSIENMPVPIQVVTHFFPARYFVTILKGIFLRGVGMEVLWWEVALLLAYAGVVFLVATRRMRQKVA